MRSLLFLLLGFFVTTIIMFAANAQEASSLNILVSVQDLKTDSKELTKKICDNIAQGSVAQQSVQLTCTSVSAYDLTQDKTGQILKEKKYNYHVEVIKLSISEKIEVITHNLTPIDELDFKVVSNYYLGQEAALINSLTNHLTNLSLHYANQFSIRRQLVSDMAHFTNIVKIDHQTKKIYDQKTGLTLTWKEAFHLLSYESPNHEKISRALIELSAVLGFASYKYYQNLVVNRVDFDYPEFSDKLKDTLLSSKGWTFDTNKDLYNVGHAFAGAIYYQIGRATGFSALKSFAIASTASLFWEVIGERKEKAAINDQIITAVGGAIIGEAGFQIARAIRKKSNSFLAQAFAFIWDPMSGVNRFYDKLTSQRNALLEDLSAEQVIELETYIAKSLDDSQSKTIGFKADVIKIEGYGKDGEAAGVILETTSVNAVAEATKNKMSGVELKLITTVAWASYYKKKIQNQQGYEFITSFSSEFEYDKKAYPVDDFNLTVHMFGPQILVNGYIGGFKVSAEVAVYADFAMINSLALGQYDKANPNQRQNLQSVIREQGYYFGFGSTEKIRLALSKANWTMFAEARSSKVKSKNDWDRFQENISNDVNFTDTKKSTSIGVTVHLIKNLSLTLRQERVTRASLIDEGYYSEQYKIRRNWIQVDYKW